MGGLTKSAAKHASRVLQSSESTQDEIDRAKETVSLWREAHQEVLNAIHEVVKEVATDIDPDALCVSRLKRYDTIIGKLNRPQLHMNLNQMCDIAGCRAIVKDNECVAAIGRALKSRLQIKAGSGVKDYILRPKPNGYRSLHLICTHDSSASGLSNLYCEVQIRTRLQHVWATALETYDVINGSGLKFNNGSPDEIRLFALMSNVFALREHSPAVPDVPSDLGALRMEIIDLDNRMRALDRLTACSGSVSVVAKNGSFKDDALCLLCVDYEEQKTDLFIYDDKEELRANQMYTRREEAKSGLQDVLLVKVSSLKGLQQAYPNYSMDIAEFLNTMRDFLYA